MTEGKHNSTAHGRGAQAPVARTSAVILGAQVSERFFTLLLMVAVARSLGAGRELDMALLALAVPTVLGDLLETITYVSLLPFLSRERVSHGSAAQWRLANRAINTVTLAMACLVALYIGLLPTVTGLMARGWSAADVDATIALGRIAASVMLLRGVAGTLAAFLMSRTAVVAAFGRLAARGIARVVFFVALFGAGWGVTAFVAATAISDLAAVAFCIPAVRGLKEASAYRIRVLVPLPRLMRILGQAGNQSVNGAVTATVLIIERAIASGLAPGSIAIVNYTRQFALLPLMAGRSVAAGLYPRFSHEAAARDPGLGMTVWRGLRATLFITLPLAAVFFVVRGPLVTVLYQRGEFTPRHTEAVASLMPYYLAAGVVWSMFFLTSRALFAAMRSDVVARAEVLSWIAYVLAAVVLTSPSRLGIAGLGAAFLIRSAISPALIIASARRRQLLAPCRPWSYAAMTALGGVVVGLGAWAGQAAAAAAIGGPLTLRAAGCTLGGFLGAGIAFLPFALAANRPEMHYLRSLLPRRARGGSS